jgi:hypothetical protein
LEDIIDDRQQNKKQNEPQFKRKVKALTEDEIHKYTFDDIIMPLVGMDIR